MDTRSPVRHIPWKKILVAIAAAALAAWALGFVAGLVVRFGFDA